LPETLSRDRPSGASSIDSIKQAVDPACARVAATAAVGSTSLAIAIITPASVTSATVWGSRLAGVLSIRGLRATLAVRAVRLLAAGRGVVSRLWTLPWLRSLTSLAGLTGFARFATSLTVARRASGFGRRAVALFSVLALRTLRITGTLPLAGFSSWRLGAVPSLVSGLITRGLRHFAVDLVREVV
jgi:hypothetical protein